MFKLHLQILFFYKNKANQLENIVPNPPTLTPNENVIFFQLLLGTNLRLTGRI